MDSFSFSIAKCFIVMDSLSYVCLRVFVLMLETRPPDATGTRVLSEVCVATPVLPSGRRCSRPAGREEPGPRNEQIGLAAGRRDESRAEGEEAGKVQKEVRAD